MHVDFEHHYVPPDLAQERNGSVLPALLDINKHLADMDEAGIDLAVISSPLGWNAPAPLCRKINDRLASLQEKMPERFIGLAHVPLADPSQQLAELAYAIDQLGLKGLVLTAPTGEIMLDDQSLWPLYEFLEDRGLPLFIHPRTQAAPAFPFCDNMPLAAALAWEFQVAIAFCRLWANGITERFTGLNMVFAHVAGGLPSLIERVEKRLALNPGAKDKPNVFFCLSGSEGGTAALHCALEAFRPQQLVFASDYPYDFQDPCILKTYAGKVKSLPIDPVKREEILAHTALKLLRLA